VNAFNRSRGRAELESLVTQFNQTYAGKVDGKGADPQTDAAGAILVWRQFSLA
jgi:hypothetical protein